MITTSSLIRHTLEVRTEFFTHHIPESEVLKWTISNGSQLTDFFRGVQSKKVVINAISIDQYKCKVEEETGAHPHDGDRGVSAEKKFCYC